MHPPSSFGWSPTRSALPAPARRFAPVEAKRDSGPHPRRQSPGDDFIRHLPTSTADQASVKAIVGIAHALGTQPSPRPPVPGLLDGLEQLGVDCAQC